MPVELSALMIKSGREGQRPSMQAFPVSGSTVHSHTLMREAEAKAPMSTSQNEEGCLLAPSEAESLLNSWHKRHHDPEGDISLNSEFAKDIVAMIGMAQTGHSMILLTE